jgi:SAM-dependent methyltransferase
VTADDASALLREQQAFYRADAEPFDRWLTTLIDDRNQDPTARRYRQGRSFLAALFEQRRPLGNVLEIAAGTGLLAPLYVPHATAAVLLDGSPESLELAARRLSGLQQCRLVAADVFDWSGDGQRFDTVIFSAWLHHVPHRRFGAFWDTVRSLLAPGGTVIFDYPDARRPTGAHGAVPDEPAPEYRVYQPIDGISTRDLDGTRWKVVHNLWRAEDLRHRLATAGWTMSDIEGPGLFDNTRWATATPVD